jgi:lipopolysaccharide/colanic/teichoic acid biosynthesis glycosyltransferase
MVALIVFIFAFPVYIIIAIVIKLDSRGPVFYRQDRVNGLIDKPDGSYDLQIFSMIKFRTMCNNAELHTGAVLAKEEDPRVTKVGKFLRRTRLDEMPQFWHVLCGDMSVVGPRPERPSIFRNLAIVVPYFEERIRHIKPGITGLAQISLGYSGKLNSNNPLYKMKAIITNPFRVEGTEESIADDMRTKMLFDLVYCMAMEKFWSFLITDIKIILKTPLVMLLGKGR